MTAENPYDLTTDDSQDLPFVPDLPEAEEAGTHAGPRRAITEEDLSHELASEHDPDESTPLEEDPELLRD